MNFEAIVFDFDGVIIDSKYVQQLAFSQGYFRVYKKQPPYLLFEEFLGYAGDSLENIFDKMSLSSEMINPYRSISSKNISSIVLNEELINLIKTLKKEKIKIGLCTGKDRLRTVEILHYFSIKNLFDEIICSDDIENPKPHPQPLQTLLIRLRVDRKKAFMVGDAVNDILCAKSVGTFSVGVLWGEGSKEILMNVQPNFLCSTVKELTDLFLHSGELI
ncbi:HAD family hydrolase [Cytobacillus kochii]|uniref:HAD family hydrolase n=1 Tax=Cytobacillus kochii TaxID=859143 RepID=UPI001CD53DCB|nr:HAD family hydrolase [Cytobacillus kochii]MCA1028628.1 HAD family hydrolase [Cytobacillus kochii]